MSKGAIYHHFKSKEEILDNNWGYIEENSLNKVVGFQANNSQFILGAMKTTIRNSAPIFAKIMYEGKKDGSITTEYPDECAQVFFLLINFWCDPMNFDCSLQDLINRLKFLQQMMKNIGADIITDDLIKKYSNSFKYII